MHAGYCCLLLVFAISEDTAHNQGEEDHGEDDGDYEGHTGLPGSTLLTNRATYWSVRGWNQVGTGVALSFRRVTH